MKEIDSENTVLIIDGGGRGATLVDKYAQSPHVERIIVVPGNDLMKINTQKPVKIYPELKTTSISKILEICKSENVDLVDVAQDNAVAVGLVDELVKANITVVGPTKKAGQLEWDKAWSRDFMKRYHIPTPQYQVFQSKEVGFKFLDNNQDQTWFVKASGLAEGKGVIPANNNEEAKKAIEDLGRFGGSSKTYLLEEWLVGEEFSAFAICEGNRFQIIGFAQDHKRVNDFDEGLNTGGMGCVSNPLIVDDNVKTQVKTIFQQTVDGLIKEKTPYKGILYLGGMVVGKKVYIIEYNARWGDPEVQVVLPGLKNDLFEISMAVAKGNISDLQIQTDNKVRVVITGASRGYPEDYSSIKGKEIFGLDEVRKIDGVSLYGAGVREKNGRYFASGGRLFYVVGEGETVIEARRKAYEAMSMIRIEGNNLHFRTDIGWRDVERLRD